MNQKYEIIEFLDYNKIYNENIEEKKEKKIKNIIEEQKKNELQFATEEQRKFYTDKQTRNYLTKLFQTVENSNFINDLKENYYDKYVNNKNKNKKIGTKQIQKVNRFERNYNRRYNTNNRYDRHESFINFIIEKYISFQESFSKRSGNESEKMNDDLLMGKEIASKIDRYLTQHNNRNRNNQNQFNNYNNMVRTSRMEIIKTYFLDLFRFIFKNFKILFNYFMGLIL
jgi:hypothetical protein